MKNIKSNLSIIIVNYKHWKDLRKCLNSLLVISLEATDLEIIVVDNLSNDRELREFSKGFPSIEFILNDDNNGFANANNVGAKVASGEYLLFLNPDTIMSENTLETLISVAQNQPGYKLISCNKINKNGRYEKIDKPFPSLATLFGISRAIYKKFNQNKLDELMVNGNKIIFPLWLSGSLILTHKNWFKEIGGWNEDYWMYYEDVDLSKRTLNANGKIALIDNINIIHNHGGSTRIDIKTKALTKAEVIISRHVYINNNFQKEEKIITQILLILGVLMNKFTLFTISVLLFFVPKLRVNIYIFKNILLYYIQAIKIRSWISKRSIKSNTRKFKDWSV